jgi:hypothetical protein
MDETSVYIDKPSNYTYAKKLKTILNTLDLTPKTLVSKKHKVNRILQQSKIVRLSKSGRNLFTFNEANNVANDSDSDTSSSSGESSSSSPSSSSYDNEEETSDDVEVHNKEEHDEITYSEVPQCESKEIVHEPLHGMNEEHVVVSEIVEIICDKVCNIPEFKTVTLDLGTNQVQEDKSSVSVLSMLYKKAQQTPLPEDIVPLFDDVNDTSLSMHQEIAFLPVQPTTTMALDLADTPTAPTTPAHVSLSAMSVPDLKLLLKEKFKNQPEKHAEIQKLKKAELIYALQQL